MAQKHALTKIGRFDMNKISYDKVCLFLGKRHTGKSYLIRDLMYHVRHIPSAVVISGSEKASPFYSDHVPSSFIYDEWDPELIENILKKQVQSKEKRRAKGLPNKGFELLLLFDDLMFDAKSWIRHKSTNALFMNGRHYKILFLVALQYALGIPPALRSNVDYIFICRENNTVNRRKIWEQFASVIPDFKLFNDIMDVCTKDYKCLVIDNTNTEGNIEDCVYWYKAKERNDFSVGSKKYWKAAEDFQYCNSKKEVVNDNMKDKCLRGTPKHKIVLVKDHE